MIRDMTVVGTVQARLITCYESNTYCGARVESAKATTMKSGDAGSNNCVWREEREKNIKM